MQNYEIQKREVVVLQAIYCVVEHFSMHAGRIFTLTEMQIGKDLRFTGGKAFQIYFQISNFRINDSVNYFISKALSKPSFYQTDINQRRESR